MDHNPVGVGDGKAACDPGLDGDVRSVHSTPEPVGEHPEAPENQRGDAAPCAGGLIAANRSQEVAVGLPGAPLDFFPAPVGDCCGNWIGMRHDSIQVVDD